MVHSASSSIHNANRFPSSFPSISSYKHKHAHSLFLNSPFSLSLPSTSALSPSSSSSSSPLSCCHVARLSTEAHQLTPPSPDSNFTREISRLQALRSKLASCNTLKDKLRVIDNDSRVTRFFRSHSNAGFSRVLASLNLTSDDLFLLKCLVAAGQEHVLDFGFQLPDSAKDSTTSSVKRALYALAGMIQNLDVQNGNITAPFGEMHVALEDHEIRELNKLLKSLTQIDRFYNCIGGIIGYQIKVLELLVEKACEKLNIDWSRHINEVEECQFLEIHTPKGIDLSESTEYASQAAIWGIEGLPYLGEIYPLGGSADRLGLVDPSTGECLPAAMLPYCGRTLLEGLIRDLQAREFLYFKLFGKECITPIAIMTSSAKNNHERVMSLCESHSWFGRGRSTFQLFEQPLVPVVGAEDGQWLLTKPFRPLSKPSGHGVIWKLAYDKGVFEWFYLHGRKGATVRQVSNVVAATDLTLLALAGIGLQHKKKLGFASCKRNSGATEGINVLMEKKNLDGNWEYGVSCIEYTEFEKFGIADGPHHSRSLQADFPANTNILYVDLPSAEQVGSSNNENSLPGMVLNTKKKIAYVDHIGRQHR